MNIQTFLKLLGSLVCFTEKIGDSAIGADAYMLKQKLEIVLSRDPEAAAQINRALAQSACNDWQSFESIAGFVAQCLTQGKSQMLPQALSTFQGIAQKGLVS